MKKLQKFIDQKMVVMPEVMHDFGRLHAFVCLPGPSLRLLNFNDLLKPNIFTIAVNTAYPYVKKPDMWIGMDGPDCYDMNLLLEPFLKIFRKGFSKTHVDGLPLTDHVNTWFIDTEESKSPLDLITPQLNSFAWYGHTLGTLMHILIHFGFKNIYLIGNDLGGEKDYYDDRKLPTKYRESNRRLYKQINMFLKSLFFLMHQGGNVQIISCTPKSPANEYLLYMPIEEAIKLSQKDINMHENKKHVREIQMNKELEKLRKMSWMEEEKLKGSKGVMVCCDHNQEWMLKWWLTEYKKHNDLPVQLIDIGMTEKGVEFAMKNFDYYNRISSGGVDGWFKKPFAMLNSLFSQTMFMDVDCHIKGDISDAFNFLTKGFCLAQDIKNTFSKTRIAFNTGVVLFDHGNKIIDRWAQDTVVNHVFYRSDQDLLERILENDFMGQFDILPNYFHSPRMMKDMDAIVVHYTGSPGKEIIKKLIAANNELK